MVLSLDASTSCVGYSVFDGDILKYCNKIEAQDSDWRTRINSLVPYIKSLIEEWNIEKIYMEDVPLFNKQSKTLVQLGSVSGMVLCLATLYGIKVEYIAPQVWRKNIGILTGDRDRDSLKIKSIEKANELFGLDLEITYTRGGNYKPNGNDDISDSILVYASTLDKYKVQVVKKSFGKGKGAK